MGYIDTPETLQANRKFIRKAMKVGLLEVEHERDLARRWRDHGDEHALHEMVTAYIRLVVSMATKFRSYGLPLGDLVQEGNVGLMQAAARFEPERRVRFSTYASWWTRSAIQEFVLRNWSIVRTGTTAAHSTVFGMAVLEGVQWAGRSRPGAVYAPGPPGPPARRHLTRERANIGTRPAPRPVNGAPGTARAANVGSPIRTSGVECSTRSRRT